MATAKKNLGKIPCPACGDPVAVYQAETGTLSYKCQHPDCESSGYAPQHTGAARKWLAQLMDLAYSAASKADPAQSVKADPKADPKTTPKAAFSLGNL